MDAIDEHATALADAIEAAVPGWVERLVRARYGGDDTAVYEAAAEAGRRAAADVGAAVRALLAADIDEQRTTPLQLLRGAVRYPTEVLRRAAVQPVIRDRFQTELLPDDVYDLSPASFADVDPSLAEPGMVWGAAKAYAHRQRHAGLRGRNVMEARTHVKVVAYVPDLMDRSKVAAAAADVTFVRQPDELAAAAGEADLVVVDVTRPGAIEAVSAISTTRVIAFSKHTNREAMDAAVAAGADQVLARSAFFGRIDELLGE